MLKVCHCLNSYKPFAEYSLPHSHKAKQKSPRMGFGNNVRANLFVALREINDFKHNVSHYLFLPILGFFEFFVIIILNFLRLDFWYFSICFMFCWLLLLRRPFQFFFGLSTQALVICLDLFLVFLAFFFELATCHMSATSYIFVPIFTNLYWFLVFGAKNASCLDVFLAREIKIERLWL